MRRARGCGLVLAGLMLVAGCGGGPPVDRKDTVKSAAVTVHFGRGAVEGLGLSAEFAPLEAAGRDVTYTIADRDTCMRLLALLATVKPVRGTKRDHRTAFADVVIHTGWGKTVQLTWAGSHFGMDGRYFESSQLSVLLASTIQRMGAPPPSPPGSPRSRAADPAAVEGACAHLHVEVAVGPPQDAQEDVVLGIEDGQPALAA